MHILHCTHTTVFKFLESDCNSIKNYLQVGQGLGCSKWFKLSGFDLVIWAICTVHVLHSHIERFCKSLESPTRFMEEQVAYEVGTNHGWEESCIQHALHNWALEPRSLCSRITCVDGICVSRQLHIRCYIFGGELSLNFEFLSFLYHHTSSSIGSFAILDRCAVVSGVCCRDSEPLKEE